MSAGLILAAGGSQRLGEPKQLLAFRGKSLISHAVDQLSIGGMQKIVIVLGAYGEQIEASLAAKNCHHVEWVFNDHWEKGQSNSLALGLRHVAMLSPRYQKLVIALCDQPLVSASHYRLLNESLDDPSVDIAATRYSSGGGVPAAIRRCCWPELIDSLSGDRGAKNWIRAYPPRSVKLIDAPQAKLDVDTQSDLARLVTK